MFFIGVGLFLVQTNLGNLMVWFYKTIVIYESFHSKNYFNPRVNSKLITNFNTRVILLSKKLFVTDHRKNY